MAKKTLVNRPLEVVKNDEIPENFNVSRFWFTKKTITYDNKTIQLSNVTKIAKYGYRETYHPTFNISDEIMRKSIFAGIGLAVLAYLLSDFSGISGVLALGCVVAFGIAGYGYYERNNKKPIDTNYYGLIIETSSGRAENLLTTSKDFIWTLFNEITKAMNDASFQVIEANFNTHEIYYDNKRIENIGGDKITGNTGPVYNRSNVNQPSSDEPDMDYLLKDL